MSAPAVRVASFTPASSQDRRTGLVGYLVIDVHGLLRLQSITVRRTARGKLQLGFPERIDRHGVRHAIACPRNREARRHIESLVFEQLNLVHGTVEDELC